MCHILQRSGRPAGSRLGKQWNESMAAGVVGETRTAAQWGMGM